MNKTKETANKVKELTRTQALNIAIEILNDKSNSHEAIMFEQLNPEVGNVYGLAARQLINLRDNLKIVKEVLELSTTALKKLEEI
jgi:hypothetical protein